MNPNNLGGPVLIQGAIDVETERLISWLEDPVEERQGPWTFVRGRLDGRDTVVGRTWIGMANAAASTALAIQRYQPCCILNQGAAGGHHPDLHRGDILLGVEMVNLGSFRTPHRPTGRGCDPEGWEPFPVEVFRPGEGWQECLALKGNPDLLEAARQAAPDYTGGRVVEGTIGSADQWNREEDRIRWLCQHRGSWAEDMESFAAAQMAAAWGIPFLSVRILSNHELHEEEYDRACGEVCQEFVRRILACLRP